MMTLSEINEAVKANQIVFRNGKRNKIYDVVKFYNNVVPATETVICVSADSYLFDKFYTMSDLVREIQKEIPATETEIREIFEEIGGNKFDIPSVYAIIMKRLRES